MSMPAHLIQTQTNSVLPNNAEVMICINSESCTTILDYFIQQRIPFQLSYSKLLLPETGIPPVPNVQNNGKEPETERITVNGRNKMPEEVYEKYIKKGFAAIPPNQEIIASELNMSVTAFKSCFRNLYGKSFYQMYMERKMEYSAELLEAGYRASEVSVKVGYAHPIKFNKMFQKHFGVTPKKYQMARK